jgi:hypothetical protein
VNLADAQPRLVRQTQVAQDGVVEIRPNVSDGFELGALEAMFPPDIVS